MSNTTPIAEEVLDLLHQKVLTLGTVESATGGLIANMITNIPGSSTHYKGSIISYSNDIKIQVVGVNPLSIERNGAVSDVVAEEMAQGGHRVLGVDICVADTGIAGPGGATRGKPVGLFYLGLYFNGMSQTRRHVFAADRLKNKEAAALAALEWVREILKDIP